jgi:hypothetical protein
MSVLDVFLAEAFPPSKKPVGGPGKPPGAAGGKPGATGKPPKPPMAAGGADDGAGPAGPGAGMGMGGGMGGGDNSDALIAAQQAEEEKARQEAEAAAAQQAAEQAERDHIKELRAAADQEVADDLDSKFNDEDDQVIWYPTVDAVLYGGLDDGKGDQDGFADHMDKKMGLKKDDEAEDEDKDKDEEDKSATDESDETEDRKGSLPDEKKGKEGIKQPEVEDEGDPERLSKKKPKNKTNKAAQRGDIVIKI